MPRGESSASACWKHGSRPAWGSGQRLTLCRSEDGDGRRGRPPALSRREAPHPSPLLSPRTEANPVSGWTVGILLPFHGGALAPAYLSPLGQSLRLATHVAAFDTILVMRLRSRRRNGSRLRGASSSMSNMVVASSATANSLSRRLPVGVARSHMCGAHSSGSSVSGAPGRLPSV